MSAISVRPVKREDRGEIGRLLGRMSEFREEEVACAMELVDEALGNGNNDSDYAVFCADSPGEGVIGFLCYGRTPMTQSTYDLYWIAVDPARRGRGAARALLRHIEAVLREKGATLLLAETSSTPPYSRARAFYLKEGFREESRIEGFYAPGDDRLIYCKRFDAHNAPPRQ